MAVRCDAGDKITPYSNIPFSGCLQNYRANGYLSIIVQHCKIHCKYLYVICFDL